MFSSLLSFHFLYPYFPRFRFVSIYFTSVCFLLFSISFLSLSLPGLVFFTFLYYAFSNSPFLGFLCILNHRQSCFLPIPFLLSLTAISSYHSCFPNSFLILYLSSLTISLPFFFCLFLPSSLIPSPGISCLLSVLFLCSPSPFPLFVSSPASSFLASPPLPSRIPSYFRVCSFFFSHLHSPIVLFSTFPLLNSVTSPSSSIIP